MFIGDIMAQTSKLRKILTNSVISVVQGLHTLEVPGKVLSNALNAAGYEIEIGNILRIQTAGDMFVAFNDEDNIGAVTVATSPAVKLVGAGIHYVVAPCKFVRSDVAASRVELLEL
jgi:hypothetical protein